MKRILEALLIIGVVVGLCYIMAIGVTKGWTMFSKPEHREPDATSKKLLSAEEAAARAEAAQAKERMKSFATLMDSVTYDIETSSKYGNRRTMSVVKYADPQVIELVIQNLKARGYKVYVEKDVKVPDVLFIEW